MAAAQGDDRAERRAAVPVLYIGGLGRSGSTLLERAIAQVDGLACVGEIVHLWQRGLVDNELCGCGAAFRECPFWTEVGQQAFGGWGELDVQAVLALKHSVDRTRFAPVVASGRMSAAFTSRMLEYGELLTTLYSGILAVSGARMVVDASKHASTLMILSRTAGVDLRLLHVVRDSPAVAYSWTKQVKRPESAQASDLMATWSPGRTSMHWASTNLLLDQAARRGVPTRLVRYEDFARDPGAALGSVMNFLGAPFAGADLPFINGSTLTLGPSHTVAGNPMRFRTGDIDVVLDEAWREQLPRRTQQAVEVLTYPVRRRYGYPRG